MKTLIYAVAVVSLGSNVAQAQPSTWPAEKPPRIVVPFAPGGTADVIGRLIANQLQARLKQSFVVENRAGAGGLIGARYVAQAAPDGYTLSLAGGASHVIAPMLGGKGPETMAEYTPIAMIGSLPSVLLANTAFGVKSVKELAAKVQTMPEGLSWGSPGTGTSGHLAGELLFRALKVKQTHVAYQGGTPALSNLLGGQIPVAIMNLPAVVGHVKSGSVVALAVTSGRRLPGLMEIASFGDEGLPDADTWYGIAGPAGMSPTVVERINAELRVVLRTEAVQKRLALEYIQPLDLDAAQTAQHVRGDFDRWGPLVKLIGGDGRK